MVAIYLAPKQKKEEIRSLSIKSRFALFIECLRVPMLLYTSANRSKQGGMVEQCGNVDRQTLKLFRISNFKISSTDYQSI